MERGRELLVLRRGPGDLCEKPLQPFAPPGCLAVKLQPVVPDVDELGDADDSLRIRPGTTRDARDECIAPVQAAKLLTRLVRDARILGPRNDRCEHAVDVQEERRLRLDPRRVGPADPHCKNTRVRLVLIGLVAGFFSALFGVGGGIVIVPLLLLFCGWEARSATATSLAAIGITAVSGVIAYAIHGDVNVGYAALVGLPAAGSVAVRDRAAAASADRARSSCSLPVSCSPSPSGCS